MLKVKPTVRPKSLYIAAAVNNAAVELNLPADMVITSGNDGAHMRGSKHYTDEALDFRTKHLTPHDKGLLCAAVKLKLGSDYDVVFEDRDGPNEHLHCEYDPHVSTV